MIKFVRYAAVLLVLSSLIMLPAAYDMNQQKLDDKSGSVDKGLGKGNYPDPVKKNRVHTAGLLWLNLTNYGGLGHMSEGYKEHCSGKTALGAELPGGSGMEYLFSGGLWFGGYMDSVKTDNHVTMQGPFVSTSIEGWQSNGGREVHATGYTADAGTRSQFKETSNIKGRLNCFYDPVYDENANAHEQFTVWYTDRWVDNASNMLGDDIDDVLYPDRPCTHVPLGLEVKQVSYAWSSKFAQKFVIIDYTIYNVNQEKNIYNFFMGAFFDNDIGNTKSTVTSGNYLDDMGGFKSVAKVTDENSGDKVVVPINMAWVADNDGRDPTCGSTNDISSISDCEPGPGSALTGATSIFTLRVLRNPNPKLRYSFNYYNAEGTGSVQTEQSKDWGPRWKDGLHDQEFIVDPDSASAGAIYNVGWFGRYDVSYKQRGYSDGKENDPWNIRIGKGGMTEGRAIGDAGRYMLMANGERDYDMTSLLTHPDVSDPNATFPVSIDPPNLKDDPNYLIYKQQHKFRPYLTGGDQADGTSAVRTELGNGTDDKFVVSFGPLGSEKKLNINTKNGVVNNKTVWELKAGDSLKLTLAFIVSENFHTNKMQDPRNPNFDDSEAGAMVNWGDAFRNAIWADRLYDVPLYDSQVKTKNGELWTDAWYGEDVGLDGVYMPKKDDLCWWSNSLYTGRDTGEGNLKIDSFKVNNVATPLNFFGQICNTEDDLMRYGNDNGSGSALFSDPQKFIGSTKKYGVMVPYITGFTAGVPDIDSVRYGWKDELSTSGDGVPDFSAPEAPASPKIKISTDGTDVTINWTSDNFGDLASSPEIEVDKFSQVRDFEGYQIWLSDTPNLKDYVEVFSVDRENYVYQNTALPSDLLDMPFTDVPASSYAHAPMFIEPNNGQPGGPDEARCVLDIRGNDTLWVDVKNLSNVYRYQKIPFGNNKLLTQNHTSQNLIEYSSSNSNGVYNYKAVLKNKLYGKKQYVAVTSGDFGDPRSKVDPLKSSPAMNATPFVTGKMSNTNKVYVVPNPYRGNEDYEDMGWEVVPDTWKEIDRKILFLNVAKHSVIRIYTLAGDLVRTLSHNGDAREIDREGDYVAKWNLLNNNEQAVTSGIYMFCMEDLDGVREKYVGKLVIIK